VRAMAFALLLLVVTGCAAPMLTMEPIRGDGQHQKFRSGTPTLASQGQIVDVAVAPRSGPTGRHELEPRIALLISLRNKLDRAVDVSERNVTVWAESPYPGRPEKWQLAVVPATAIENEIRSDAAWSRAATGVAAGLSAIAATAAGVTTHSGQAGGMQVTGTSYNAGAAMQAQRQVAVDAAAADAAIGAQERAALVGLHQAFQRNTVEPGAIFGGAVLADRPQQGSCSYLRGSAVRCKIVVKVEFEGETHTFTFNESGLPAATR
jgi:hypothetical protein